MISVRTAAEPDQQAVSPTHIPRDSGYHTLRCTQASMLHWERKYQRRGVGIVWATSLLTGSVSGSPSVPTALLLLSCHSTTLELASNRTSVADSSPVQP